MRNIVLTITPCDWLFAPQCNSLILILPNVLVIHWELNVTLSTFNMNMWLEHVTSEDSMRNKGRVILWWKRYPYLRTQQLVLDQLFYYLCSMEYNPIKLFLQVVARQNIGQDSHLIPSWRITLLHLEEERKERRKEGRDERRIRKDGRKDKLGWLR